MEFAVDKKEFQALLGRMLGVSERKSTMPVLANVLLEVGKGEVTVTATDLYVSLRGTVRCETKGQGSVGLPGKDLHERVRAMPDGQVVVSGKDASATTLKAAGSSRRYTLRGMPGDDFPDVKTVPDEGARTVKVGAGVLRDALGRTLFSVSRDETKVNQACAYVECRDGVALVVTTDGHRLTKLRASMGHDGSLPNMMVPRKLVEQILKVHDAVGDEVPVEVSQSGGCGFFRVGETVLSGRLIDGQYVPFDQVIPRSEGRKSATVGREALADAVKAVALASDERMGGVRLAFERGVLKVEVSSPEAGEGFDEVPCDYQGAPVKIGLRAGYILDALGALPGEERVVLGFDGEFEPVVITPANGADFLSVVMPMRL